MSDLSISLNLDREDRTWRTGETISGTISIQAESDQKCKGITLILGWAVHGAGSGYSKEVESIHIDCADITAGDTDIPFSFELPRDPVTYHGEHLNIDWRIQVYLHLPWSLGMNCTQDLLVLPGPTARAHHALGHRPKLKARKIGLFAVIGLALAIPGAYRIYTTLTGYQSSPSEVHDDYLIGGIMLGVGLIWLFSDLWNLLASSTLGKVEVSINPSTLKSGDALEITTSFTPRTSREINGINTHLFAFEKVVFKQPTSGDNTPRTSISTSTVHTEDQLIKGPIKLRRGHRMTFKQSFVLPADAPASFEAGEYSLAWRVSIDIDIPMRPDWSEHYDLVVDPRSQRPIADIRE